MGKGLSIELFGNRENTYTYNISFSPGIYEVVESFVGEFNSQYSIIGPYEVYIEIISIDDVGDYNVNINSLSKNNLENFCIQISKREGLDICGIGGEFFPIES